MDATTYSAHRNAAYLSAFTDVIELWLELERTSPLALPHELGGRVVMHDIDGVAITAGHLINLLEGCPAPLADWIKLRTSRYIHFDKCTTYGDVVTAMLHVVGGLALNMKGYLEQVEMPEGARLH